MFNYRLSLFYALSFYPMRWMETDTNRVFFTQESIQVAQDKWNEMKSVLDCKKRIKT